MVDVLSPAFIASAVVVIPPEMALGATETGDSPWGGTGRPPWSIAGLVALSRAFSPKTTSSGLIALSAPGRTFSIEAEKPSAFGAAPGATSTVSVLFSTFGRNVKKSVTNHVSLPGIFGSLARKSMYCWPRSIVSPSSVVYCRVYWLATSPSSWPWMESRKLMARAISTAASGVSRSPTLPSMR